MRMNQTIHMSRLIDSLKKAENEGETVSRSRDLSGGVKYLFDFMLVPLMNGIPVNTGELDMDAFDRDDLDVLYDYYNDNYTAYSREMRRLRNIYEACLKSHPKAVRTAFL